MNSESEIFCCHKCLKDCEFEERVIDYEGIEICKDCFYQALIRLIDND